MQFTSVFSISALILSVLAAPQPVIKSPSSIDPKALDRRAPPETLILANCDPNGDSKSANILYYKAGHEAKGAPDDNCSLPWLPWEDHTITCKFMPSATTVTVELDDGASHYPFQAVAGSANNGRRSFLCRRDNEHIVWTANRLSCRAIYYCQVY